jgi:hypothetical protein
VAHSHRYRRFGFPLELERSLVLSLTGDPARAAKVDGYFHVADLRTPGIVPLCPDAIVAELVSRGWSRKNAARWFIANRRWSHHEMASERRIHYRSYRARMRNLVAAERFDDLVPYTRTCGWLTW